MKQAVKDPRRGGEYLCACWERRLVIAAMMVLFAALGLVYDALVPREYDAQATLIITPQMPTTVVQAIDPAARPTGAVDVASAVQVIVSGRVAAMVKRSLGSAPAVTATEIGTTNAVLVTTSASSPRLAQRSANAYASDYIETQHQELASLLQEKASSVQQQIAVVQAAMASEGRQVASAGSGDQLRVENELSTSQAALRQQLSTLQNQLLVDDLYLASQRPGSGQVITWAALPRQSSNHGPLESALLAALIGLVVGVVGAVTARVLVTRDNRSSRVGVRPMYRDDRLQASPPEKIESHVSQRPG